MEKCKHQDTFIFENAEDQYGEKVDVHWCKDCGALRIFTHSDGDDTLFTPKSNQKARTKKKKE